MMNKQAAEILANALIAVMNCEGVARRGAIAEGSRQDCSEFDKARDAFAYLEAHGVDTEKLWQAGDKIAY